MNYTKQYINASRIEDSEQLVCEAPSQINSSISSLTTYKKVVDIPKEIKFYGLTQGDYELVENKKRKQNEFLCLNYLYDKISGTKIYLHDLVVSANHNSDRYHALIQNRINSLTSEAKEKNLKPIFMTLTLPSEYHRFRVNKITKKLELNPKYNDVTPREAVKRLTKMFAKLRQDRSLKELSKDERIYFRVNEPHKSGTPHTHILMFIPKDRIKRVVNAFKRLFNNRANDIKTKLRNAASYVMKYINKTLPLSKKEKLSNKEKYLNTWYSKHRIIRFNSSRTLAPLKIYRLVYEKFSLIELTKLVKKKALKIFETINQKTNKIMEINFGNELIYKRSENYILQTEL